MQSIAEDKNETGPKGFKISDDSTVVKDIQILDLLLD